MKRFFTYLILPVLALAASCAKTEPIDYAHEQQAFQTRSDKILLEVIMPQASASTDEIYIVGAFNGGEAAIGDDTYLMTHSETITSKWGIYLDPAQFQGGKTLADGFTFYNMEQGFERSARNEAVSHTLTIGPGQWANVYADKWEKFFQPAEEEPGIELPEHDGVRIYIIDQTGWDAIALYQWGDVNHFGGEWPGAQVAGTWTANGQEYKYFEYGDEIFGLGQNLIFNNNGGGTQLADYNVTFAEGVKDYFFLVTADGVEEAPNPAEGGGIVIPEHDGVRVWVDDQTGWDEIALYQWGDVNHFGGEWPGAQVAGSETFAGVEYKYFEYGDDIFGLAQNLIFNNNNNGTQLPDYNLTFEEGVKDYFFQVTADGVTLLDTPGSSGSKPEPEPEAEDGPKVYVQNKTTWGGSLFAHYWGTSQTQWPGYELTETVTIGEATYLVLPTLHGNMGQEVGIIFHAEDDALRVESAITLDTDRFYTLTNDALVEDNMGVRLFVKNNSRWPGNLFAHIWFTEGEETVATEWPGIQATPGYAKDDVYDVLLIPDTFVGKNVNVIFHSDENDSVNRFQTELAISGDIFYNLNIEYSLEEQEKDPVTLYVNDKTAWEEISVYLHGDINNLGGGWPGISMSRTEEICGITFKVFEVPNALTRNENLIFNNGGNGIQLDDFNITFTEKEYYLIVTADAVALTERPVPSRITFFVDDQTGWDAISLYQWGDVGDLGGGWPGAQVGGTVTIGETAYKVFTAEQAAGLAQHLIFNDNGGGIQLPDFDLTFEKSEYFLTVTATGVALKEAPTSVVIFVDDQTGWDALALYQWGDVGDLGGGWPGMQVQTTITANQKAYKAFVVDNAIGLSENLIFNNNGGGTQLPDYPLTYEKNTYYLKVSTEGVELN